MSATTMCLVCVFDGLRPDFVRPDWTPNVWKLRERGVWFSRSHCVFPSVTRVNAASLVTGSFPGSHGLEGNTIWRPRVEPARPLRTGNYADLIRLKAVEGRAVRVPTMGEVLAARGGRTVAIGTGSPGCAFLLHPEAGSTDGLLYHHDFSSPSDLAGSIAARLGPPPAGSDYAALAVARVDHAARALTEFLIPEARPALSLFWITVPDGHHHHFGLGAPESVAGIREADAIFGSMLDRLQAAGLSETTDIFVTADHGYATVSGHVDVAAELVRAGLKRERDSTDLVVCADGGACLIYAEADADVEALSSFLLGRPWVSAVASHGGDLPGTLPLAAINCEHGLAPTLVATLAWQDRANGYGVGGLSMGHGAIPVGAGDHGGISPFEMRNTLIAAGPHFRAGHTSDIPCGIVDVAPTLLRCLDVEPPATWDGRVLVEALAGADRISRAERTVVEAEFAGRRQALHTTAVDGVRYTEYARMSHAAPD